MLRVWLIRDIYFNNRKSSVYSLHGDAEAAIELTPTFLEAIMRG